MTDLSQIDVFLNQQKVGTLALTKEGVCAFQYDMDFVKKGFSISPFFLNLSNDLFLAKPTPFRGNFGVFDDSLPDGWGHLVMDRYLREKGINPNELNLLQRLALIGTNGRGALEYKPNWNISSHETIANFQYMADESERLLNDLQTDELERFYHFAGTSGGVRPKVFAKISDKEYLIKFRASNDPKNIGEIEYRYALLAKQCGIVMPDVMLIENKFFATERFDRTPKGKIHTISAAGLLHADFRMPSLDYEMLLKACHQLTQDMSEVEQLIRRMIFNVLIENKDDHAKNFAFQYIENRWKLSPAYDILPSSGFNWNHTTTINGKGKPTKEDMCHVATKIGFSMSDFEEIYGQVLGVIKQKDR
ncbi:MAG: type II toxin-antitoxin system HipA family toxin [Bacteroidales bacterium]|nr:type II toxin-antitoxin system HipA family toxin [Bacteroidales bacterium]